MTLREELEDRADKLDAELLDLSGRIKEIERQSNELHTCLNALDIAEMDAEDAALEDAGLLHSKALLDEMVLGGDAPASEDEQPELHAGPLDDDASYFDPPITVPESDGVEEERERAAAIELTADVEPEIQALIESGEHSYDEVAAIAYPEPQWNEPQTEGYAPVTNPEADALAKAHDYYSPEKVAERNRFNPWGIFKREPEEVS
jgi:hypothetical protein